MKTITTLLIAIIVPFVMNAQHSFDKYENMKDVSAMVMTSKMFKLLSKIDFESKDAATQEYINLVEHIEYIKVFSTTNNTISQQMKTDVASYLTGSGLEELMRVTNEGKQVQFYTKPGSQANYVRELFMFLEGPKTADGTVIVTITGDIDLKQISKLADDLNIPGSTALKEVK